MPRSKPTKKRQLELPAPTPDQIPTLKNQILLGVKGGLPPFAAAALNGVPAKEVWYWRKQDKDFDAQMHRAEGERTKKELEKLKKQGSKDWRSTAWVLEKTTPELAAKDISRDLIDAELARIFDQLQEFLPKPIYNTVIDALYQMRLSTGLYNPNFDPQLNAMRGNTLVEANPIEAPSESPVEGSQ